VRATETAQQVAHGTRYMDMTPERLREVYRHWRQAEWLAAQTRHRLGVAVREVEFIERVARKRQIHL